MIVPPDEKVKNIGQPERQHRAPDWSKITPYALLALGSFLCFLLVLGILIWQAERLVALGLIGNLYYLVLFPLLVSVALVLFGILKSYAVYTGEHLGGKVQLGGSGAFVLISVALAFILPKPAANFSLTVYIHGAAGPQDIILKGTGYVVIDTQGLRRKAPIGNDGEAIFTEIPANLRGQEVPIALDADGYELAHPQEKIHLTTSSAYVEARRKAGRVTGYVRDDQHRPLANARVVGLGIPVVTNQDGYFDLAIPGERLQPSLTLEVFAPGFEPWTDTVVPDSNEVQITLHHQR